MKRDPFDFSNLRDATKGEIAWRVAFLLTIIVVVSLDLFVWRP